MMIQQDPYAPPTQSGALPTKPSPWMLIWLSFAIIFAIAHGLLNWWSLSNVSGGFWVMEGGNETPVERLAEVLTLLLNVPGMLFCYVWYKLGFQPLSFTKPVVAIANSCFYGATLALLAVYLTAYCIERMRTKQYQALDA